MNVPCDGCTACCRGPGRECTLDPDDDPTQYLTYEDGGRTFVAKGLDDTCVYLIDGACSIYDRRPLVCRRYDCREVALEAHGWRVRAPLRLAMMLCIARTRKAA